MKLNVAKAFTASMSATAPQIQPESFSNPNLFWRQKASQIRDQTPTEISALCWVTLPQLVPLPSPRKIISDAFYICLDLFIFHNERQKTPRTK